MDYDPRPIDTSKIEIGPDLRELVEQLAEHTHDVWATKRLAEGWQYGPRRNDELRETPDLVPYGDLPDIEKNYDRAISVDVLKFILARRFRIIPPESTQPSGTASLTGQSRSFLADSNRPVNELAAIWATRDRQAWASHPELYRALAEEAVRKAEPVLAYDVVREGLEAFRGDVRLRQLGGLALARSGATEAAIALLSELEREGDVSEETLGILARCYKDLSDAGKARELYLRAHETARGYWTGINAATLYLIAGQHDAARALASEVQAICQSALRTSTVGERERYWVQATLGESALIRGDEADALQNYAAATGMAAGRFGDLSTTRRNARMILRATGGDSDAIEQCFDIPNVGVFAGHMIDQPGRAIPRFPPELEEDVARSIEGVLESRNIRIGYCSLACGADILFAEALRSRSGEVNVVLPYGTGEFMRDSVDIIPGGTWRKRGEKILAEAASVRIAADHSLNWGGAEYEYVNLLLQGLAAVRAQQLDTRLTGVAVWNGQAGDGRGGTSSVVSEWERRGIPTEIVRSDVLLNKRAGPLPDGRAPAEWRDTDPEQRREFEPEVVGLLFADVVGFSKLKENEMPVFVREFLGLVASVAAGSKHVPVFRNTWGDAVYLVFSRVAAAGDFALELLERIRATDWQAKGIRNLNLRVGLHAGPVYRCTDPVTGRENYAGTQVSRAARIEPITPPGYVYASEPFAALASIDSERTFQVEYVGQLGMAKQYGVFPTYVLKKNTGPTQL